MVVFDPLDGSSNIDAGISTGSIFGIYAPSEECAIEVRLRSCLAYRTRCASCAWSAAHQNQDMLPAEVLTPLQSVCLCRSMPMSCLSKRGARQVCGTCAPPGTHVTPCAGGLGVRATLSTRARWQRAPTA